MKLNDLTAYVLADMRHRKVRVWLTVLGIVIGISAVVLLISISTGLQNSIQDSFKVLGTNYVAVIPGSVKFSQAFAGGPRNQNGALTINDAKALQGITGVDYVNYFYQLTAANIEFKNDNVTLAASAIGGSPKYWTDAKDDIEFGTTLRPGDTSSVLIGHDIAFATFTRNISIGDTLKINNHAFRVAGIYKAVGSGGFGRDKDVTVDERSIDAIKPTDKNLVDFILVITLPTADIPPIEQEVQRIMRDRHRIGNTKDDDFTTFTAASIAEQVGQVTGTLATFVLAIAGMALIVGAVGIANAMFASVLERTREIGIYKSLGASDRDVLSLFLVESALIGLIGGVLGLLLALFFLAIGSQFGVPVWLGWQLFIFAIGFSVLIGVLSGVFPARRAAKLDPVEALRYE